MTSRRKRQTAAKQARKVTKSRGTTRTEKLLARLCDNSFLRLWSYANPYKDDGHELCDVIAVFEDHVFIFFDREKALDFASDEELELNWDRWRRRAIDRQIKTAHGAERYLRSGRAIFNDAKAESQFPLTFDRDTAVYHKIIVAHGAEAAVKKAAAENLNGSLAIEYGARPDDMAIPFVVSIDRNQPVHILDTFTLPVLLRELDTLFDLREYLVAKERAIATYQSIFYCGEEDLLAHYFSNLDEERNRHFIGTSEAEVNTIMIAEGEWNGFIETEVYKRTKIANQSSYLWDELIQHTSDNALRGELLGDGDPFTGNSALIFMAREPRFIRRTLSDAIASAIRRFPGNPDQIQRMVTLMPSFDRDVAYVFLQFWVPYEKRGTQYREKRQRVLEIACGAAKITRRNLRAVIGIAIDAPRFADENAEDFLLMHCDSWSDAQYAEYAELNEPWRFFQTSGLEMTERSTDEFVSGNDYSSQ